MSCATRGEKLQIQETAALASFFRPRSDAHPQYVACEWYAHQFLVKPEILHILWTIFQFYIWKTTTWVYIFFSIYIHKSMVSPAFMGVRVAVWQGGDWPKMQDSEEQHQLKTALMQSSFTEYKKCSGKLNEESPGKHGTEKYTTMRKLTREDKDNTG